MPAILKIKKNSLINNLIESIIRLDPSKKKDLIETEQMDLKDRFKSVSEIQVKQGSGNYRRFRSTDDSDPEENQRDLSCPECTIARQSDGYRCNPDTAHLNCSSCNRFFPNRSDSYPQKCEICDNAYCGMYLSVCSGGMNMMKLEDHRPDARLADSIFRSNSYDLDVCMI